METIKSTKSKRYFTIGLLFITLGLISLLQHIGIYLPDWLWEWHTFVLCVGLLMGYRKYFKPSWWILWVVVGGFFTFQSMLMITLTPYVLGSIFIILGLFLLLKPMNWAPKCDLWHQKPKTQ